MPAIKTPLIYSSTLKRFISDFNLEYSQDSLTSEFTGGSCTTGSLPTNSSIAIESKGLIHSPSLIILDGESKHCTGGRIYHTKTLSNHSDFRYASKDSLLMKSAQFQGGLKSFINDNGLFNL